MSHIFPEIRLEACRLVRLLLSLCPDQVIGSWPYTSTSTILEGLRLAVGLGGKKGEGGQTGVSLLPASKLITLRAMLEFIQHALKSDASTGVTFEGWLSPDPLVAQHATMRDVAEDSVEHGWLAGTGIGGWGLEPLGGAGEAAWEIGRLDGAGESGEEDEVDDVLSVRTASESWTTTNRRNRACSLRYILFYSPHSLSKRRRLSTCPKHPFQHPPQLKIHQSHSAQSQ